MGFPGGSDGKENTCSMGDLCSIPGLRRSPGGGHGNPLQHSYLENPHGQRSLVGYSPWGHKVRHDRATKYTNTQRSSGYSGIIFSCLENEETQGMCSVN